VPRRGAVGTTGRRGEHPPTRRWLDRGEDGQPVWGATRRVWFTTCETVEIGTPTARATSLLRTTVVSRGRALAPWMTRSYCAPGHADCPRMRAVQHHLHRVGRRAAVVRPQDRSRSEVVAIMTDALRADVEGTADDPAPV
jgi:hypothetical protein